MTLLKRFSQPLFLLAIGCAWPVAACGKKNDDSSKDVAAATTSLVKGPAGDLFVTDGGHGGLPVVFVHSFAGSSEHWKVQLAHVRPDRRAIALDLRGHGKSAAPDNADYSVDALASDVEAVVNALKIDRFVLVGHSMGGAAAALYTGAHGDRVAGLMLVGTPGKTSPDMAQQTLAALNADYQKTMDSYWQSLVKGAKPEVADRLITEGKRVPMDESMAIIDGIFAYNPLPALDAYRGPKLLVDTAQSQSPDSLHNEEPTIPQMMIEGTSHWPQLDKPDEFNAVLDDFLELVDMTEK